MPVFNGEEYIAESIRSVVMQDYTNWELIIVNDGSTDQTESIISSFVNLDNRIKTVYQRNGRQGKARNLGIKMSKGKFIAFLDSDDKWDSAKLTIQVKVLNERHDVNLLFSSGYTLMPDGNCTEMNVIVKEWRWDYDINLFIEGNRIPLLSVMLRRDAFDSVNGFIEIEEIQKGAEDLHLWIKLLKIGNFLSIDDKLFYYRLHQHQVTSTYDVQIAVAYCYYYLVVDKVLSTKNRAIKNIIKSLIFKIPDLKISLSLLEKIFPKKSFIFSLIKLAVPITGINLFLKKITFHVC